MKPSLSIGRCSTAFVVLCLVASPALANGGFFPGCPQWNHQVTFINDCSSKVTITETPGCYPGTNQNPPFDGGRCWPDTAGTFTLDANGGKKTVDLISCWSGNFGVDCVGCKTDIRTLAEFTFDGGLDSNYNKLPGLIDTYDISMVDGFVKPMEIKPDLNVPKGGGTCVVAGCSNTPQCPSELDNGAGSCLSPCKHAVASGMSQEDQEKYCCVCSMTVSAACAVDPKDPKKVPTACQGQYGCSPFSPPGKFNPGSACCPWFNDNNAPCNATTADRAWDSWAQDYIADIHAACPNQYAWQYDDLQATVTCQGQGGAMNYTVTLCP